MAESSNFTVLEDTVTTCPVAVVSTKAPGSLFKPAT